MFLTFYFFVLGGPFCGNADIHDSGKVKLYYMLRKTAIVLLGQKTTQQNIFTFPLS